MSSRTDLDIVKIVSSCAVVYRRSSPSHPVMNPISAVALPALEVASSRGAC
jgi:hypothetical protein